MFFCCRLHDLWDNKKKKDGDQMNSHFLKWCKKENKMVKPNKPTKILMIGDSITDAGRNREKSSDLGHGYPLLVAAELGKKSPGKFQVRNRGISGNKIKDVHARFQEDCLDLKPDVVSILIGINDTWHNSKELSFGSHEAAEQFENVYRSLLDTLHTNKIKKIVLLEPFVLPEPVERQTWRVDLDPKIQIVRKLAQEYGCCFVPLDGRLNALGIQHGFEVYTGTDGVHPTPTGHAIIAEQWLTYTKAVLK